MAKAVCTELEHAVGIVFRACDTAANAIPCNTWACNTWQVGEKTIGYLFGIRNRPPSGAISAGDCSSEATPLCSRDPGSSPIGHPFIAGKLGRGEGLSAKPRS